MIRIIVEMAGGLGNQLSQYAMMRWLENKYPQAGIWADIDYFKKEKCHNGYELEKLFDLKLPYMSRMDIRYLPYLFRKKRRIEQIYTSGYPEDDRLNRLGENEFYILRGTWHNYDYSHIMNQICNELQFPKLRDQENINYYNDIIKDSAVSIHVRGGDYKDCGLNICTDEYYLKAIDLIKSKVENPKFYIFTDDETDLRNFVFCTQSDVRIIRGNKGVNAWKDMYLMTQCRHNILANSTFSYWGGMLNRNPGKIVIRPRMQTPDKETWKVKGWYML